MASLSYPVSGYWRWYRWSKCDDEEVDDLVVKILWGRVESIWFRYQGEGFEVDGRKRSDTKCVSDCFFIYDKVTRDGTSRSSIATR